jgi:hypothetical protein
VLAQPSVSGGELVVGLCQMFRLQGMEDLSVVDSGDESICNGVDGLVKVQLGGEGVKSGGY